MFAALLREKKQLRLLKDEGQHLSKDLIAKKMWRSDGAKFSLPESGDDSGEDSNVSSTNHISIDLQLPSGTFEESCWRAPENENEV